MDSCCIIVVVNRVGGIMTYLTIKRIKGNPYLYEVRSVREGDRVRQVFVRYLGRADRADAIERRTVVPVAVAVEPEIVVPEISPPIETKKPKSETFTFRGLHFREIEGSIGLQAQDPDTKEWIDTDILNRKRLEADYAEVPDITLWKDRTLETTIKFPAPATLEAVEPEVVEPPITPEVTPPPPQKKVTQEITTPEQIYDKSLEDFRQASKDFAVIRDAYRAKEIGDAEFLKGKEVFDVASQVSDAAETEYINAKKDIPVEPTLTDIVITPTELPLVGKTVSGLTVRHEIPNQASIESSLEDYEILPGIREIPTSETGEITQPKFYSVEQEETTRKLAEEIKTSGEINPLILVITDTGDYILEGSHRLDALRILGIKSFPAQVVIDRELVPEGIPTIKGIAKPLATPEVTPPPKPEKSTPAVAPLVEPEKVMPVGEPEPTIPSSLGGSNTTPDRAEAIEKLNAKIGKNQTKAFMKAVFAKFPSWEIVNYRTLKPQVLVKEGDAYALYDFSYDRKALIKITEYPQ